MLRRVLSLDVLAGFTSESLQQFLSLDDAVAKAWRAAMPSELQDWAGNLAKKAGCTRQTVYARQKDWRREFKIDIALPYALYRDLLHFGPSSLSDPQSRSALAAAVWNRDGEAAVRVLAEVANIFDAKRVNIVGSTINSSPHPMSFKVARSVLPRWTRTDLNRISAATRLDGRALASRTANSSQRSDAPRGRH
jgi:hypothetical protein